jgi:hypothetical protein
MMRETVYSTVPVPSLHIKKSHSTRFCFCSLLLSSSPLLSSTLLLFSSTLSYLSMQPSPHLQPTPPSLPSPSLPYPVLLCSALPHHQSLNRITVLLTPPHRSSSRNSFGISPISFSVRTELSVTVRSTAIGEDSGDIVYLGRYRREVVRVVALYLLYRRE